MKISCWCMCVRRQRRLCEAAGSALCAESADEVSGWTRQVINTACVVVYVREKERKCERRKQCEIVWASEGSNTAWYFLYYCFCYFVQKSHSIHTISLTFHLNFLSAYYNTTTVWHLFSTPSFVLADVNKWVTHCAGRQAEMCCALKPSCFETTMSKSCRVSIDELDKRWWSAECDLILSWAGLREIKFLTLN